MRIETVNSLDGALRQDRPCLCFDLVCLCFRHTLVGDVNDMWRMGGREWALGPATPMHYAWEVCTATATVLTSVCSQPVAMVPRLSERGSLGSPQPNRGNQSCLTMQPSLQVSWRTAVLCIIAQNISLSICKAQLGQGVRLPLGLLAALGKRVQRGTLGGSQNMFLWCVGSGRPCWLYSKASRFIQSLSPLLCSLTLSDVISCPTLLVWSLVRFTGLTSLLPTTCFLRMSHSCSILLSHSLLTLELAYT